jgi:predicted nucleotidyltransferase
VVYRAVLGSRAFGLDHAGSDVDRRGIYLAPASRHWSVYGVPEQLECDATQECYWEIQKFIALALRANPNILEVLYAPEDCVELCSGPAAQLRTERRIFLSKLIYQTYNGYAMSQFDKLKHDLKSKGSVKPKHAMHMVRLLYAGIHALQSGELAVRVGPERDELIGIRDGRVPWEQIDALRLDLHRRFEAAFASTSLPDRPDYDRANSLLIEARRNAAGREFFNS